LPGWKSEDVLILKTQPKAYGRLSKRYLSTEMYKEKEEEGDYSDFFRKLAVENSRI
jgi:hypothetical protein